MLRKISLLMLAVLGLWACNQNKVSVTDTGLKYQFHVHDDNGRKAKQGEIMTIHLQLRATSPKDTVIRDTYKELTPLKVVLQPSAFKGSFEEGLAMLSPGDSATFYVPADSLFGKAMQALPPFIAKGSDVAFTVRVISIQNKDEYQKEMAKMQEAQKGLDAKLIADYLAKNKITNFQKTETGLHIVTISEGTGELPAKGDSVTVRYTGKLMSGKVFDANTTDGIRFPVGGGWVVPGWDEGIMKMKKGGKSMLILPSALGYGGEGAGGVIPPNATLLFDIELADVKKKK